jgi:hypothetical protein
LSFSGFLFIFHKDFSFFCRILNHSDSKNSMVLVKYVCPPVKIIYEPVYICIPRRWSSVI